MQAILDFFFANGGYTPHGFCIAWNPVVLWTHVFADLGIALAYFAIPALIVIFLKQRKDPDLLEPAILFVAFITACGLSHLVSIVTLWHPIYGVQGTIKAVTALISVITAIVLARLLPSALAIPSPTTLNAKVAELETANAELRAFAHASSHELRAPLWSLATAVEMLNEAGDDVEEVRALRQSILSATRRMQNQISAISTYAALLEDDLQEVATVDVNEVAERAIARLGLSGMDAADLQVEALPRVRGRKDQLIFVFEQILSNAVKFAAPGQSAAIRIMSEAGDDPRRRTILIEDSGVGMSDSEQTRVLNLFQRGDDADATGAGFGLALVRRVVAAHGGTLHVRSREGAGTEVRITLYAARTFSERRMSRNQAVTG